jgi:hypothetical protein
MEVKWYLTKTSCDATEKTKQNLRFSSLRSFQIPGRHDTANLTKKNFPPNYATNFQHLEGEKQQQLKPQVNSWNVRNSGSLPSVINCLCQREYEHAFVSNFTLYTQNWAGAAIAQTISRPYLTPAVRIRSKFTQWHWTGFLPVLRLASSYYRRYTAAVTV